jgi:hypothetical protein
MSLIVVGETANEPFRGARTFDELSRLGAFVRGPSRARLLSFGLDLDKIQSMNLCSPGRWDPDEACDNAHVLVGMCLKKEGGATILAFGSRCSMAFGMKFEPLRIKLVENVRIVSCPHPSGLSHWWNDWENRRRFKEMVYGLA